MGKSRHNPHRSGASRCVLMGPRWVETVVLHAANIAGAFGVPLTVLRVLELDSNADATPPDPLDWGVRQRKARGYLERLVSLAGRHAVDVQSELSPSTAGGLVLIVLGRRQSADGCQASCLHELCNLPRRLGE